MTGWLVEHVRGTAADLFTGPRSSAGVLGSGPVDPTIRFVEVDAPVLVLGSAQRAEIVGTVPAWINRRSGGGAVWLDPEEQVWVDVIVPAEHPLWHADVAKSFDWLGDAWANSLKAMGVDEPIQVHGGRLMPTAWSGLLCFAGRGPGEVFVHERKLVGISQRRSRHGVLFQCGLLLRWTFEPDWFAREQWPGPADEQVRTAGIGLSDLGINPSRQNIETSVTESLQRSLRDLPT